MSYPINQNTIEHVMTLYGDFPAPLGEIVLNEDGFEYQDDFVLVKSTTCEDESGVFSRKDVITNVSNREITINRALSKFTLNGGEAEIYTQFSEWCEESQGAWQPLNTQVSAHTDEIRSNSGAAPFTALYNLQTSRGLAFHIMAKSSWSYNIRKYFLAKDGYKRNITVELGINCENFSYKLKAGESLELPEILYYEFRNKVDLDAFKLHRYANRRFPAKKLPIIYNSWMSNFDDISFENLSEQLAGAKKLGCDYFVIDAGWFGEPHKWGACIGDWIEREDCSLRGRMSEFAQEVRKAGLKFGLWFEIERAAATAKNYLNHPEHYIFDGSNAFVNFASKDACDYIFDILAAQIRKYKIEFIKFDFNRAYNTNNETDAFLKYFEGYNAFIERLKAEFPEIYLENCAGGGTRLSLSNLPNFNSFWMSDNHNMFRELDIYKNSIKRLPCRALEKWITIRSIENFKPSYASSEGSEKILMSSDGVWNELVSIKQDYLLNAAVGGPIGISCDLTKLSDRLMGELAEFFEKYKAENDFWRNAECHLLVDTESMLIMQFNTPEFDELKIFVFARHINQTSVTIYPVTNGSDYTDGDITYTAKTLNESGFEAKIPDHFSCSSFTLKKA